MTERGTVAVTGASGFLGTHLLPALAEAEYNVVAVGRHPPGVPMTYRPTTYERDSLVRALEGSNYVIHLAARTARSQDALLDLGPFLEPNVLNLRALAEAAQAVGVHRVLFASSRAVYPSSPAKAFVEGEHENPRSTYGLSKLYGESYLRLLSNCLGLDSVFLRFAMLFGEGERESPALMRFARMAGKREPLILTGNVTQRVDPLYVKDAVGAILAAIIAGDATGPINVGSGQAISLRELAMTVNEVFGNPDNLVDRQAVDGPPMDGPLEIERARRLLGWRPRYNLRDGLEDFRRERMSKEGGRSPGDHV